MRNRNWNTDLNKPVGIRLKVNRTKPRKPFIIVRLIRYVRLCFATSDG
jgi:hypothetical protein